MGFVFRNIRAIFWIAIILLVLTGLAIMFVLEPVIGAVFFGYLAVFWVIQKIGRAFGLIGPDHYWYFALLPWRTPLKWLLNVFRGLGGTSEEVAQGVTKVSTGKPMRWMSNLRMLTMMYQPGLDYLGRLMMFNIPFFMPLGAKSERHSVAIGMTGSRKTALFTTILALHKGNSLVIDPQDRLTATLYQRRGKGGPGIIGTGQDFYVIAPQGTRAPLPSASWNVFDEWRKIESEMGRDVLVTFADSAANMLVQQDSETQPVFANVARSFLKATMLHVYATEPPATATLQTVRQRIMRGKEAPGKEDVKGYVRELSQCMYFGNVLPNMCAELVNKVEKEGPDFFTSCRNQTEWMDDPLMVKICRPSNVSLYDIKFGNTNLHVSAETKLIRETMKPYIRLLFGTASAVFELTPGRPQHDALVLIDELPNLGNIPELEDAAPTLRSAGLRLFLAGQELAGFQKAYPHDGWRRLLGGADFKFWLVSTEPATLKYIEEELGGLMSQTELRTYLETERGRMIITQTAQSIRAQAAWYWKELPVYYYNVDPDFKDSPLRAIGRQLMQSLIPGLGGAQQAPASTPAPQPSASPPRSQRGRSSTAPSPGRTGAGQDQNTVKTLRRSTKPKPVRSIDPAVQRAMDIVGVSVGYTERDLAKAKLSAPVRIRMDTEPGFKTQFNAALEQLRRTLQ